LGRTTWKPLQDLILLAHDAAKAVEAVHSRPCLRRIRVSYSVQLAACPGGAGIQYGRLFASDRARRQPLVVLLSLGKQLVGRGALAGNEARRPAPEQWLR
jgi:hypothetical protein